MEKTSNEDSEDQKERKTIGTYQTIVSEKTLVNLISQQIMNKYSDHGYTISQLLDCGVSKSLTSKQNSVDLMTQHRLEGICSVDYIMSLDSGISSELFNAMSTIFFVQQVLTIAHVGVSMNLTRRQQMSNNINH